jgi:lipopolysaccharide/colanic/teichoic acid biosynthesis glycosyltransferase/acetyltransferase-like isoleucine patch superfamily enzyme
MRLIILRRDSTKAIKDEGLLRFALSTEPVAHVVFDGLSRNLFCNSNIFGTGGANARRVLGEVVYALPQEWHIEIGKAGPKVITFTKNEPICIEQFLKNDHVEWSVISNGCFAAQPNGELLKEVLANTQTNVIAINVRPELLAYRERVRLTAKKRIVGIRRLHNDSVEPVPICEDWPHHVLVRNSAFKKILLDFMLPYEFSALLQKCRLNKVVVSALDVAGVVLDLATEYGLLNYCAMKLRTLHSHSSFAKMATGNERGISKDARIVGRVFLGNDIRIGSGATVIGPTIIGNHVTIERRSVINSSIICSNVKVPSDRIFQNSIIKDTQQEAQNVPQHVTRSSKQTYYPRPDMLATRHTYHAFRSWPLFSYARMFKRVVDVIVAIIVLILFAPVMPFIALAIKLSSPGPIFFKHKRQGRHGKEFQCLKFRTMNIGADEMQERLRVISEVDGPQFKMADDPRINSVGEFLRETYIDEIPQFLNVFLGQMSVVGPRPSPESENTLCPTWRDARLSVRPGITGLWQVCRTRESMKDFQEWIYYDIKYVRELSLYMDIWIGWQTFKKMVDKFISQF